MNGGRGEGEVDKELKRQPHCNAPMRCFGEMERIYSIAPDQGKALVHPEHDFTTKLFVSVNDH